MSETPKDQSSIADGITVSLDPEHCYNSIDPLWMQELHNRKLTEVALRHWDILRDKVDVHTFKELLPDDAQIVYSLTFTRSEQQQAMIAMDGALLNLQITHERVWGGIAAPDTQTLESVLARLDSLFPPPPPEQEEDEQEDPVLRLLISSASAQHPMSRPIPVSPWEDIRSGYADETRSRLERLFALDKPASGGKLIIFHGEPGTGKTFAAASLGYSWRQWCSTTVVSDPEALLRDPTYLLTNAWYPARSWRDFNLIILEDTGEVLSNSARRETGQALSRLLNATDGMLGMGSRTLFLISTNEPLDSFHPAVTRAGRCLSSVDFLPLSVQEAQKWLVDRGAAEAAAAITGPTALADLYAIAEGRQEPPPAPRCIGFTG